MRNDERRINGKNPEPASQKRKSRISETRESKVIGGESKKVEAVKIRV